jgi:hypothetical protein
MSIRKSLIGVALVALSFSPWIARAAEGHAGFCMLASFRVGEVGSLYVEDHQGRGNDVRRFAGARLFLPAQPGLTAEWIEANLVRHIAEAKAHPSYDCPLDVAGATATASSAGTGFWVQISASDADAAKEILNRSRRLVR